MLDHFRRKIQTKKKYDDDLKNSNRTKNKLQFVTRPIDFLILKTLTQNIDL